MVEEGSPAPVFTLTSDSGEQVSLESLRGRPVVSFYPKEPSLASSCSKQSVSS
jgi:peroxiredoxin